MIVFYAPWPAIQHELILPNPELSDSKLINHTVQVKRSMTGVKHTHVQRGFATYGWTFVLTRMKAIELLEWCRVHLSNKVLARWKGVDYVGYIVNNPIELDMVRRAVVADSVDEVDIKLEFRTTE